MIDLLDKLTRIAEVRGCAVIDIAAHAPLVSWLRDGGDTAPLEAAARDVYDVSSSLMGDSDGPSLSARFENGARLLARRYGNHFAIVVCEAKADLVNVRVALQGLALKISLHQRALSLSGADPSPSASAFQAARERPSGSAAAAPKDRPSGGSFPSSTSSPASKERSSSPDASTDRPSTPSQRAAPGRGPESSSSPPSRSDRPSSPAAKSPSSPLRGSNERSIGEAKMREELVRLFAGQLGPLAPMLLDEQIKAHGGMSSSSVALAVGEALLQHIQGDDLRARVRKELDRVVRGALAAPAAPARPSPSVPPPTSEPYRSMPDPVDDKRISSLGQLFVEFVGPIGKVVFAEELAAVRTGPLLLKAHVRTLLAGLAQHVPSSSRKSFLDRGEKLIG